MQSDVPRLPALTMRHLAKKSFWSFEQWQCLGMTPHLTCYPLPADYGQSSSEGFLGVLGLWEAGDPFCISWVGHAELLSAFERSGSQGLPLHHQHPMPEHPQTTQQCLWTQVNPVCLSDLHQDIILETNFLVQFHKNPTAMHKLQEMWDVKVIILARWGLPFPVHGVDAALHKFPNPFSLESTIQTELQQLCWERSCQQLPTSHCQLQCLGTSACLGKSAWGSPSPFPRISEDCNQ